jgi:antitoxin component of MazEF toxin-antitoxin module
MEGIMGYPTKVQQITRKNSKQFYISFPQALARAMGFEKGEQVEWEVKDRNTLILKRVTKKRR